MSILAAASAYIIFVIQTGLVPYLAVYGAMPNLIVVIFLVLIMIRQPKLALAVAGIGGLLFDIFSPFRFGLYTLINLGLYFSLERASGRLIGQTNLGVVLIATAGASLLAQLPVLLESLSLAQYFLSILYNTMLALPIFWLLKRFSPREAIRL